MNTNQKSSVNKLLTKYGYIVKKSALSKDELKKIKKELTVRAQVNEKYSEAPPPFKVYRDHGDTLVLPRYYGIQKLGAPDQAVGMVGKPAKLKFQAKLRDNQQIVADKCINHIKNNGGGLLSLPCGYGKTVIALYIACALNLKTLVVVHKTFLQNQWYDRIQQFTNAKVGMIRQNKIDTKQKDIVVGMLQSISMKDYDTSIFEDFDLVIVDEVHHTGSRVFSKAHFKTGARYTLGLSATPYRSDGLTKVLHWHLGDMIHREVRKGGDRAAVRVFRYESKDKKFRVQKQWVKGSVVPSSVKMTTSLVSLDERNDHIIDILNVVREDMERKILVLSARIDHLKTLKAEIDKHIFKDIKAEKFDEEYTTSFYIGGMREYQLRESSQANIIFATYAMAEEGLDIPELNTLILATSKSSIVQSIGRILRKKDMVVPPLIIDIIDNLSMFNTQGNRRCTLYKSRKYSMQTCYLINGKFMNQNDYRKHKLGNDISDDEDELIPNSLKESLTNIDKVLEREALTADSDNEEDKKEVPKRSSMFVKDTGE